MTLLDPAHNGEVWFGGTSFMQRILATTSYFDKEITLVRILESGEIVTDDQDRIERTMIISGKNRNTILTNAGRGKFLLFKESDDSGSEINASRIQVYVISSASSD